MGSIPGSGRSPGEGNGNPFQCSCLENPHGQRSLAGYSPWGRKELPWVTKQQQGQSLLSHPGKNTPWGTTLYLQLPCGPCASSFSAAAGTPVTGLRPHLHSSGMGGLGGWVSVRHFLPAPSFCHMDRGTSASPPQPPVIYRHVNVMSFLVC